MLNNYKNSCYLKGIVIPKTNAMRSAFSLFLYLLVGGNLLAQQDNRLSVFTYRNFSVGSISAWISDIAVPQNPDYNNAHTFYVAARHGGVWKTNNNGVTFQPVFDRYGTTSIGAVEVAPGNPETVWVGTGEAANARSSHSGNGVYKSVDGGKQFTQMGLEGTRHIARVLIHPKDENTVYVAAMGNLFSACANRGVYKTLDGGQSWEQVLFINENTGIIDLVMDPLRPSVLYAATYEKYRYPWHLEAGGPNSGIYKTTNGGKSWVRLSGGLPEGKIGRIGLSLFPKNPNILYAVVENLNPVPGEKGAVPGGEVYKTSDGGKVWRKMNPDSVNLGSKAAYSFNQILVDPNDENRIFINSETLQSSTNGGKSWQDLRWPATELFADMFGDVRCFWINPKDSRHMMIGSDGGVYVTWDGGKTVRGHTQLPLGEIYNVAVDQQSPYQIYAGLQDHEGWKVASNGWRGSVGDEDWTMVGRWDGMYLQVDPFDNRWVYTTTQFGNHQRVDQLQGERYDIQPPSDPQHPLRYTWNTPLLVSPHNGSILFTGGQYLLRSLDRGNHWEVISPDLTRNDPKKIAGQGHIMYCTISSISESPLKAGVLWVGTDDGKVWYSPDHGKSWLERSAQLEAAGGPGERYVARIAASRHDLSKAWVIQSGFRNDDFKPWIFVTRDHGQTWTPIAANLPDQPISAFLEDPHHPDILYVGNDHGVYISLNGGQSWLPFNQGMPPVPVKDLVMQSETRDLVAGTYGRGIFVADLYPLQEFSDSIFNRDFHLFQPEPQPQMNYSQQSDWGNFGPFGNQYYRTPNEPNGIKIFYWVGVNTDQPVTIFIRDSDGNTVAALEGPGSAGTHQVVWNTRDHAPGTYNIVLETPGGSQRQKVLVRERWLWPVGNKAK